MKTTKNQCIHHWVIDSNNIGQCSKCGLVKDFGRLMLAQERTVDRKLRRNFGRVRRANGDFRKKISLKRDG